MDNLNINVETEKPLQAGAFGYKIRFIGVPDLREEAITILIQDPEEEVVEKTGIVENGEEGVVSYTVEDGDFSMGGTYRIQLEQVGEGFKFLSPVIPLVIFGSLSRN
jgi:hypothetical protein